MLKRVWAPSESCRVEMETEAQQLPPGHEQIYIAERLLKRDVVPVSRTLIADDECAVSDAQFPSAGTNAAVLSSQTLPASVAASPSVPSDCIAEQLCSMSFPVGMCLYAAALHPTSINAALNWAVNNGKRTDSPIFFPASICQRDEWVASACGVGASESARLDSLERVVVHASTCLSLQHLLKDSRVAVSVSAARVVHALLQWKVRSIILDSVAPAPPAHPLMAKSLLDQAIAPLEHAIARSVPAGIAGDLLAQFRKIMSSVHYCNGHGLGSSKCHYSGLPCWCRIDLKRRGSPPMMACIQVSASLFPGVIQSEILMPSDILQLQALLILMLCQGIASKMLESADTALKRALPSQFNDPLYDFDILDAVATDELLNETFPNCQDFKGLEEKQKQQQQQLSKAQEELRILHEQKMRDHLHQQQLLHEQEMTQSALLSQQLQEQQLLMQKLQQQQIELEEGQKMAYQNHSQPQQLQPPSQQQHDTDATSSSVHHAQKIKLGTTAQHFTVLPDSHYRCNICGCTVRTQLYHLKRYHSNVIVNEHVPHANDLLHLPAEVQFKSGIEAGVQEAYESQQPLECAAGTFCTAGNTSAAGSCPAGSFCPYASLGPAPTLAAVNAKRKQMDEFERQLQDPKSLAADAMFSATQATRNTEKKRQKTSAPSICPSRGMFTAWDSFAALPEFKAFAHDCTERALLALLPSQQEQQSIECILPQGSRSETCEKWVQSRAAQQRAPLSFSSAMLDFINGERVWDPSSHVDFTGIDASIPETYRSFVVVTAEKIKKNPLCSVKLPISLIHQAKNSIDKNQYCMRVKQKLLSHINVSFHVVCFLISCSCHAFSRVSHNFFFSYLLADSFGPDKT
jgi:hypothetical protein